MPHGVPSANDILRDGDLVNFDITLEKNGYIADSSKTYLIGEVSDHARQLARVTYEAMCKGIAAVRPGALRELGRIEHTQFILDWLQSVELGRRAQASPNKGEARNSLARAVFFN